MKELYLVRGLQGSGKTTLVNTLLQAGDVAIAADDFMINEKGEYEFDWRRLDEVHQRARTKVKEAMEAGVSRIFVHNTSIEEKDLEPYQKLAKEYGYRMHSIIVENRHGGSNEHTASNSTVEKKRKLFDIKL